MIKHDLQQFSLDFLLRPGSDAAPARRYILPISSVEADTSAVLHRVWELAGSNGAEVWLVGLGADPCQEPALRRMLVTLTAVLKHDRVEAHSQVFTGRDWARRLKAVIREGDLVICWDEQPEGYLTKPLSRLLQTELNAPLLILSKPSERRLPRPRWLLQAAAWTGILAMLVGFFFVQVRVLQFGGSLAVTLGAGSAVLEIILLSAWNNLLS